MDDPNDTTTVWRIKRVLGFMHSQLFAVVLGAALIVWLVAMRVYWPSTTSAFLPIDVVTSPVLIPGGTQGAFASERLAFHGRGVIELSRAHLSWVALSFVWATGTFVGILAVLRQLTGVFTSLAENEPFADENDHRIRTMGFLIIGLTLFGGAVRFACWLMLPAGALVVSGLRVTFNPLRSLPGLLVGFILIALAEVFRVGAALRQEQEQTV
jgi:hypothetical protein